MSPNALASKLLQYSGTTSLLVPGALIADLGPEAVQDAINRGWLRPDLESGTYLTLTNQQAQINEMRELAETPEGQAPAKLESTSRTFALGHSGRNLQEAFGTGLSSGSSLPAPGSGQSREPGPARQPVLQTPTSSRPGQDYMVGEDVMIADEGKSYQAKVQAKNADGTYRLSFGPNRPVKQDRMFRREEMQKIAPERENTVKVQPQ